MKEYIKISECKSGYLYLILARHARVGICIDNGNAFTINREKLTETFLSEEYHWDFDPRLGTVKPFKEIEKAPELKNDNEIIKYLSDKRIELNEEINILENMI